MTNLEEKVRTAEERIKELELLIEHWKKQNETNTGSNWSNSGGHESY